MKLNFVIVFLLFTISNVFSQDIQSWIRYGMTINEIKQALKISSVTRNGVTMEFGSGNGLGSGVWAYDRENNYGYVTNESLLAGRAVKNYHFVFNQQNKLIEFWFMGEYNFQRLLREFTSKYGQPTVDMGDFTYYSFTLNMPNNVEKIIIVEFKDTPNFVNIAYFLKPVK